eukprot:COSAG01_NODE_69415_length_261_cov_0.956790_1_plen_47_part_01
MRDVVRVPVLAIADGSSSSLSTGNEVCEAQPFHRALLAGVRELAHRR